MAHNAHPFNHLKAPSSRTSAINAYLQSLLCRAAGLLLQLPRLQCFNVFITLLITIIQQVLFGLQQALTRCNITNSNGKATIG